MDILNFITLSFEAAERINRSVDIIHSFFPSFSFLAVFFLFESYLPALTHFESSFERFLTYFKIPFIVILDLTLISQGFFGGCLIYYPQTWFNQVFLNVQEPYEYGLFGRQYLDESMWGWLQLFYFIMCLFALWRTTLFFKKRVFRSERIAHSHQPSLILTQNQSNS